MSAPAIPGYRLNDPALPRSPLSQREFDEPKGSLLFGADDVAALRKAHPVVADQVEAIAANDYWRSPKGTT